MNFESEKELGRCANYWAKILRLEQWDIYVRFGNCDEMIDKSSVARCVLFPESREAQILILRKEDFMENAMQEQNQERDLVHELLHIVTWWFDDLAGETQKIANRLQERSITDIANALVRLRKQMCPKGKKHCKKKALLIA